MFPKTTKFLVADDTKTIRTMVRDALLRMGFENIVEAEDGTQALDALKKAHGENDPIQFIFCDWNMPGLTGLDLLEIRNSDQRFKEVPFLMVTIESERDYVLKAVAMGVSDYVVKPFSEATIQTKLQSVWNRLKRS